MARHPGAVAETTLKSSFEECRSPSGAKATPRSLLDLIFSLSFLGRNRNEISQQLRLFLASIRRGLAVKRAKSVMLGSSILLLMFGINSAHATTSTTNLTEKHANKTVAVKLGSRVELALHSMYWQITVPPKSASLTSKGAPILKPIFPSPSAPVGCRIAGSGCGTQTWIFSASKVGLTHLVATRTTCGEAMKCTARNSRFSVTVKVSR